MTQRNSWFVSALVVGAFVLCAAPRVEAVWMPDGVPVCAATGGQWFVAALPDGSGGTILAWQDYRGGDADMYVQKLDYSGTPQWTANGLPLSTISGEQEHAKVATDGSGGAMVTWQDDRTGDYDVFVGRVDASGDYSYGASGGTVIASYPGGSEQKSPVIVSDDAGGAIIAWTDNRNGSYDIYAQRVDGTCSVVWGALVPLVDLAGTEDDPRIVTDGEGGAIVAWVDNQGGNDDIYAQRVNSSGSVEWVADGVVVSGTTGDQNDHVMIPDGDGGAFLAWRDTRSGAAGIYVQRISDTGASLWTAHGVLICTAANNRSDLAIIDDGSGGALITWQDARSGNNDIYAQRVNASGVAQWASNGVIVCDASDGQYSPVIAADGDGGSIIVWFDLRGGATSDLYAQKLDSSGSALWAEDGLPICTASGSQSQMAIAAGDGKSAVVAWQDTRGGVEDIYAERIGPEGQPGGAPIVAEVIDVPGDQGGKIRVAWKRSGLDALPLEEITHYNVWRSMTPAAAASYMKLGAEKVSPGEIGLEHSGPVYMETSNAGVSYSWEWLATLPVNYFEKYGYTAESLHDSSGSSTYYQHFLVSAHTSSQSMFWNSTPDSGYSVDNLAPCPPVAVAAEYTGGNDLFIHWNSNTEIDLSHYAVYRGTTPSFVPDETNRVGTATDTTLVDGGYGYGGEYYYKISAIDIHDNESPFALLTPDMIVGAPGGGRNYADMLFQNAPNPFLSSTHIVFSIKEAGHVRLTVFDVKGRLVRVLANEVRQANRYTEIWDGKNGSGRSMPAGTYFYSLETPGWKSSKKMTLAR